MESTNTPYDEYTGAGDGELTFENVSQRLRIFFFKISISALFDIFMLGYILKVGKIENLHTGKS